MNSMKNKIVYANSNPDTGESVVTIQNKYGHFTGRTRCCPEDLDTFSPFVGERYAETRAAAAFARFRLNQEKIKRDTICNYIKDCISNNLDINNKYVDHAYAKLHDYEDNIKYWTDVIDILNNSISQQDKERTRILERSKQNNLSK